jgi:hypothetical protein
MTRQRLMLISAATVVVVIVCCFVWFLAGFVADIPEDYPETILQTEVSLGPAQFGTDSTTQEWYNLSVNMLQEYEWDVSPNLTHLYAVLQCTPKSQEPVLDTVHMQFADAYFIGIVPSIKFGDVYLRSANETASVEIAYQPLRWRHTNIDTTKIEIDWRQALEIGQQHTGVAFLREVGDRCLVGLQLDEYMWRVSYGDSGVSSPWIGPTIWIDARTGKVLDNQ